MKSLIVTPSTLPTIVTDLLALCQRPVRDQRGLFLAEGVRHLAQAIAANAPLEAIIYCPSLLKNPFAQHAIRHLRKNGVHCTQLAPAGFQTVTHTADPQGVLLVARQNWLPLSQANPNEGLCWLVLDNVQSFGNLGSILRSADAAGVGGTIFLGDLIDPFESACVRATMGAIFSVPLVRTTWPKLLDWKRSHDARLIGTSPGATVAHNNFSFEPRTLLWMGGERKGLSAAQQAACDAVVKIPMHGRADSLNVSVATGILLFEIARHHQMQKATTAQMPL